MKTEKLKEWGLDDRQIGMVMRENGLDIEAVDVYKRQQSAFIRVVMR